MASTWSNPRPTDTVLERERGKYMVSFAALLMEGMDMSISEFPSLGKRNNSAVQVFIILFFLVHLKKRTANIWGGKGVGAGYGYLVDGETAPLQPYYFFFLCPFICFFFLLPLGISSFLFFFLRAYVFIFFARV